MKNKTNFLFVWFILLMSCSGGNESRYPMDKRFWSAEDYDVVIRQIKYRNPKDERYPEFKNPETSIVIKKLVDPQNFLVFLDDEELGVSHRSNLATDFFNEYKDLSNAYYQMDRQDKFMYGRELIEIQKFGLELQLRYFKLGNDDILKDADDPNSSSIQRLLSSNRRTIVKNFNNYLDYVNKEDAMDEVTLDLFCDGISEYFKKLYEVFPDADASITRKKAELMQRKAQSPCVSVALNDLLINLSEIEN